MKIWMKILVTVIAGTVTYLLTKTTKQPEIWQLTMSVFVAGVVLVVQVLVETAEQVRVTRETVSDLNTATSLLADARANVLGDSVENLVRAAAELDPRMSAPPQRFAVQQIERLTRLLEGLKNGRANRTGDDRDWLLGLTEITGKYIDATSMTTFAGGRGFVDEQFWDSELGRSYLREQKSAIARGVRIRRVFLFDAAEDPTAAQIRKLLAPHRKIGVKTKILPSAGIDQELEGTLWDFILFDRQISYDLQSARSIAKDTPPLISAIDLWVKRVAVAERYGRVKDEHVDDRVTDRVKLFKQLWKRAEKWTDPAEAASTPPVIATGGKLDGP